jgi:hypothetical protein
VVWRDYRVSIGRTNASCETKRALPLTRRIKALAILLGVEYNNNRSKPLSSKECVTRIVHWLLSGVALFVVAKILPGNEVDGLGAALIAALSLAW